MTNDPMAAQAADALQAVLSSQDGLRAYVLVDGALLDTLPDDEKAPWPAFVAASLLDNADDDARRVGPLLFEWRPAADSADAADATDPRSIPWPAASVLVSPLTLAQLAAHLAPMVDVQLEQMESAMLMRFFDPRVLPFWLDMLPPAHRAYLAQACGTGFIGIPNCRSGWRTSPRPPTSRVPPNFRCSCLRRRKTACWPPAIRTR